jgi:hypothetical protein
MTRKTDNERNEGTPNGGPRRLQHRRAAESIEKAGGFLLQYEGRGG